MSTPRFLDALTDTIQRSATVKVIYGDPVEAAGKTIVPVARVSYGFGGGYGIGKARGGKDRSQEDPSAGQDEGGGGGGHVNVTPLGVVEITPAQTRYLPIRNGIAKPAGAFAAGLLAGVILGHRFR